MLVAAERAFWLRNLIDHSVRNPCSAMLTLGLEGRACLVSRWTADNHFCEEAYLISRQIPAERIGTG
jgi:hypothetical protein